MEFVDSSHLLKTRLNDLLKEIEKTFASIEEADSFSEELFLNEAYSELIFKIKSILSSILSDTNPAEVDFFSEFSEVLYHAWRASLENNIDSSLMYASELEKKAIDVTELREAIEKARHQLVKADRDYSRGNYKDTVDILRESTVKLHGIKDALEAKESSLVRKVIWKLITIYGGAIVSTVTLYLLLINQYSIKFFDLPHILYLALFIISEFIVIRTLINRFLSISITKE